MMTRSRKFVIALVCGFIGWLGVAYIEILPDMRGRALLEQKINAELRVGDGPDAIEVASRKLDLGLRYDASRSWYITKVGRHSHWFSMTTFDGVIVHVDREQKIAKIEVTVMFLM